MEQVLLGTHRVGGDRVLFGLRRRERWGWQWWIDGKRGNRRWRRCWCRRRRLGAGRFVGNRRQRSGDRRRGGRFLDRKLRRERERKDPGWNHLERPTPLAGGHDDREQRKRNLDRMDPMKGRHKHLVRIVAAAFVLVGLLVSVVVVRASQGGATRDSYTYAGTLSGTTSGAPSRTARCPGSARRPSRHGAPSS